MDPGIPGNGASENCTPEQNGCPAEYCGQRVPGGTDALSAGGTVPECQGEQFRNDTDGTSTEADGLLRCASFDLILDKRNHEANAIIGGPAPSLYSGKDRIVASMLANILGGPCGNSLLNTYLRDRKGWVYAVECSYTQYSRTGIMAVILGCERENIDNCLAAVRKILADFCENEMSETKLRKAKKQMLGQLAIAADNGEAQCLSMGKSLLSFGEIATSQQTRQAIMEITAGELRDAARRIFDPQRLSTLVYL